jgi:hypothetical protein
VAASSRRPEAVAAVRSSASVLRVVGPSVAYVAATDMSVCLARVLLLVQRTLIRSSWA